MGSSCTSCKCQKNKIDDSNEERVKIQQKLIFIVIHKADFNDIKCIRIVTFIYNLNEKAFDVKLHPNLNSICNGFSFNNTNNTK